MTFVPDETTSAARTAREAIAVFMVQVLSNDALALLLMGERFPNKHDGTTAIGEV